MADVDQPTQPTPYYTDELVTLYHGDCLEITEWITADVLVTDPPYGISWTRHGAYGSGDGLGNAHRGIKNDHDTSLRDEALTIWGDRPAAVFGSLKAEYPAGWKQMLVFGKPTVASGMFGQRGPWLNNWEPIFILGQWPDQTPSRDAVLATREKAGSGYSGYVTRARHPHAKPVDVLASLIEALPQGLVADPFAGSGSTLVAAKLCGRSAVGVEIEERYCESAAKRLAQDVLDFDAPGVGADAH